MKKDNSGMSLLELVIAFAILGIVSVILLGFITTSGRMYNSVSSELSLQMKSQIAMAQIREYVVDCSEEIRYDSGSGRLLLIDSEVTHVIEGGEVKSESESFTCHVFRYDRTEKKIFYGVREGYSESDVVSGKTMDDLLNEIPAEDLLVEGAEAFSVSKNSDSLTITLVLADRGKTYDGSQTVALRNRPRAQFK